MRFLSNLTIKTKFLSVPLLTVGCTALLWGLSLGFLDAQKARLFRVVQHDLAKMDELSTLFSELSTTHVSIYDLLASAQELGEERLYETGRDYLNQLHDVKTELYAAPDRYPLTEEEQKLYDALTDELSTYVYVVAMAMEMSTVDLALAGQHMVKANRSYSTVNELFHSLLAKTHHHSHVALVGVSGEFDRKVVQFAIIIGIVMIGIGAMTVAISNLLSREIIAISGVTTKLATGDRGVDIPYVGRKDEIGVMAHAIQTFKKSLIQLAESETTTLALNAKLSEEIKERHHAQEALRKANEKLEQRVEERTAALKVTNEQLRREVEERKSAEQTLRSAKEYAEILINSSLDMIVSVDVDRNIIEFNRAAEQAFGYSKSEVLGRPVHMLYAEPSESLQVHAGVLGEGGMAGEVMNRRKNGDVFCSYLAASPMIDGDGRCIGIMGISRDITDRKRAEQALYESNQRLEEALAELKTTQQKVLQQERLRALGEMASGIAHDFNNALAPVVGYSELILDRPEVLDEKEKLTHYVRTINTAAKDAANVVRRLREFYRARDEDEVKLPVDLNQLVEEVVTLTQPRWKDQALAKGVTIRIETALEATTVVAGNEAELREALTNLIFNAVDAMPEGGTITVRTVTDGDSTILEVSDTGTGMTEEVRARCLEPFYSTKGKRGTGLGLAMVYGIIHRHRGTLRIESEPGRGATFVIGLPVGATVGTEEMEEAGAARTRRLRILVVDDEALVRQVTVEYLTGDGHTVETAVNGREGLEKFIGGWFDVVVADQGMPEMSGDQMAASIKDMAPDKPVILLTGFGDLIKASGDVPASVDLILSKPVTLTSLRQGLAKVV